MMPRTWTKLRPHPEQARLWRTSSPMVAVVAGRGSGKTELARRRVVRMLQVRKRWPDPLYFYALPTYAQAKRVAWQPILNLIPKEWLASEPNISEMCIRTVFGSTLYIVGMDKPARVEGVQWDGCVIDESSDQKPKSFDLSVSPALTHRDGWCWRIGVPKRFGIGAQDFKAFYDRPDVDSFTWKSETVLTPEQIVKARERLDGRDYSEQYEATWESASGLIFHNFNMMNVDGSVEYDPDLPLCVTSDFNVDPMAWLVCQQRGDCLIVLDEIWLRNTNTEMTLNALFLRWGARHAGAWEFYGDASGKARKTSAAQSDVLQITNDKRFSPKRVKYLRSNPPKADRFAACNALIRSGSGVRRLLIHPRCKQLIADLQARAYKDGTRDTDDHGDVGHISDALGYIVYYKFPLKLLRNAEPHIHVMTPNG